MKRTILVALAVLSFPQAGITQDSSRAARVWDVSWRDVSDSQGRITRVPFFALGESARPAGRLSVPQQISEVVRLEEGFRQAQLSRDSNALTKILSEQFYEIDADGRGRGKAAELKALSESETKPVTTTRLTARAADNAVMITGEQTLVTAIAGERTVFSHVYVRESTGEWKLLSRTVVRTAH